MRWAGLLRKTESATTVEYAVMLMLVLMAVFAAIGLVGTQTNSMWGNAAQSIESCAQDCGR